MLTNFLRLLALVSLIVAIVWYINDRTYEPFLALLGAIAAFTGSFWINRSSGSIRVKNLKSRQGGVTVKGESGGDISAKDIDAKKDVEIIQK